MFTRSEVLAAVATALSNIENSRFFESERGFQGQLIHQLQSTMAIGDQAIIEQEYQKRLMVHGLTIRPDIVIHEPYSPQQHESRSTGNIAAIEIKLRATAKKASEDYASLARMIEVLNYPLGIFINIASSDPHAEQIPKKASDRIVSFAVHRKGNTTHVVGPVNCV